EIVVVELNSVHAIFALQVRQNAGGSLGRLDLLAIEYRNHSAEVASERTPYAGLVHRGAGTQESRQDIICRVQPVIREPGKIAGGLHGPLRVVHVESELVAEGESADLGEVAPAAQRGQ